MTAGYFLGVDIGTYSSKGVLVGEDGKVIASHSLSHSLQMPHPGHFEHDADQVWWDDFVHITRLLLENSGADPKKIQAIGVSGIGPCVLPVDEQGRPLRPGILYGIDTRASAETEYLDSILGQEEIFDWSAMHLSAQAAGPKVLWIRNHEPEIFAQARWFLTSQAYLVFRLTGLPSIDIYTAGSYAPLFDVFQKQWRDEAAGYIVPIERLPPALWSHEIVGTVSSAAAKQTGLAEGTPVVTGTADAAAEALSAGMANTGDMLLMFGSSIFFILATETLARTRRFWGGNFLQPGTFALAGGMSTAGSLTTWFRDQFAQEETASEKAGGPDAYAALESIAENSTIGANGLICLPYFEGERTPLHDPHARGMWFGLSLKHTRADLYRAILEGVAFGIRHNLEAMAEEGVRPQRILVSGGGVRNRLWMQIVADTCGIDLVVPDQLAGASYGDAFLAAIGSGLHRELSDIQNWVSSKETVYHNPKNYHRYDNHYQIYRDLYKNTKTQMHQLNAITAGGSKHE